MALKKYTGSNATAAFSAFFLGEPGLDRFQVEIIPNGVRDLVLSEAKDFVLSEAKDFVLSEAKDP
jgi:hypothetical protein